MPLRILAVCTANVCRSPMAAALLRQHLEANGVEAIVTSAGTHAGSVPIDPKAVETMEERGFDITPCSPRLLDRAIVAADGADLVVTMTRAQLRAVAVLDSGVFQRSFTAKNLARRTLLVPLEPPDEPTFESWRDAVGEGRLARDQIRDDPSDDIADPYGGSLDAHRRAADELDALMAVIARSLAAWMTSSTQPST